MAESTGVAPELPELKHTVLRLATPEQLVSMNAAMHDIFYEGYDLSREALDAGFARLAASSTRTDGRLLTWALVPASNPEVADALTYAHTIRRAAHCRPAGASSVGQATFYSIQSVCTPRAYRRKGYARHMLSTLHHLLGTPAAPIPPQLAPLLPSSRADVLDHLHPAIASVLSSDLAPGWYEACPIVTPSGPRPGWVSTPDRMNTDLYFPVSTATSLPRVQGWARRWVYQRDLDELAGPLSQAFAARLAAEPSSERTLLIPDPAGAGWMHHLEIFDEVRSSRMLRGPTARDTAIGVRFWRDSDDDDKPYAPGDPLVLFLPGGFVRLPAYFPITMISDVPPSLLPQVLGLLAPLAAERGNAELRCWGLDERGPLAKKWEELGGRIECRTVNRRVPYGLAWYGDGAGELVGCEMWAFT